MLREGKQRAAHPSRESPYDHGNAEESDNTALGAPPPVGMHQDRHDTQHYRRDPDEGNVLDRTDWA